MASSLSSKPFVGSLRTESNSMVGLSSLRVDISQFPFSSSRISIPCQMRKKFQIRAAVSSTGRYFRVTSFAESDGKGVGCVIDGCPPCFPITEAELQVDLDRARLGERLTTAPGEETHACKILSGTNLGFTTLSPIYVYVPINEVIGHAYGKMSKTYSTRAAEGVGRYWDIDIIGSVAAGALAKKFLKSCAGIEILVYVSQVGEVEVPKDLVAHNTLTLEQIESTLVMCPNSEYAQKMIDAIDDARIKGNSIGGTVTFIVRNCPKGLGSEGYDNLKSEFVKAILSLPGSKGIGVESGFSGFFTSSGTKVGVSNGKIINMKAFLKPTPTVEKQLKAIVTDEKDLEPISRIIHDPCIVPRVVPILEANVSLALMDMLMAQRKK